MAAAQQLRKLLDKTIIYYAPGEQGLSEPQLFTASEEQNPTIYTTDNEKAVAECAALQHTVYLCFRHVRIVAEHDPVAILVPLHCALGLAGVCPHSAASGLDIIAAR